MGGALCQAAIGRARCASGRQRARCLAAKGQRALCQAAKGASGWTSVHKIVPISRKLKICPSKLHFVPHNVYIII